MIYSGSRYEDDPIDRVLVAGEFVPTIYHTIPPPAQAFAYSLHLAEEGTRLDFLAHQFYDDPELGWIIANANPELFYPDIIPVGTVLRIPDARVLG